MNRVFSVFGSRSTPQLGPLERRLLREVWSRGNATVRELVETGRMQQAYTTVMTTMDRLYKKGLLDRAAEGKAFRYSPRHTPEELQRGAAIDGIKELLRSDQSSSLPLSYLVEAISAHDAQLLDELQVLIERKRRELEAKDEGARAVNLKEPK
jgi:predicted transcriptional regulator